MTPQMSKALIAQWFGKLGPSEKTQPLLVVNGLAYTPQQTYDEVMRGTPLGTQLQALVEKGTFGTTPEDQTELAKIRLQQRLSQKDPNKPFMASLPSSGVGVKIYTPAQIIQEINSNTPLGQQFITSEIELMKKVVQVR
jgi:hypothetical protein